MRLYMHYPITIAPPPNTPALTGNFVAYALNADPPDVIPEPPPPPPGQHNTQITVPVQTTIRTQTQALTSQVTEVGGTQTQAQTTTQRLTSAMTNDWNRQTLQTVMPDGEYVYRNTVDINNPTTRNTQWLTDVLQNTTITTGGGTRNTDVTTAWESVSTRQTNRITWKPTANQSLSQSQSVSQSQSTPASTPTSVPTSTPTSTPVSQHDTTAVTTVEQQTVWSTTGAGGQRQTDVTYNAWPGVTDGVWRTTDQDGEGVQTLVGVLQNTQATTEATYLTYGHNTWDASNNVMRPTTNGENGTTGLGIPTTVITNTTISTMVDGPAPTQTTIQRTTNIPGGTFNTTATTTVERNTTWPTAAV